MNENITPKKAVRKFIPKRVKLSEYSLRIYYNLQNRFCQKNFSKRTIPLADG
jgi:hypothetical protein